MRYNELRAGRQAQKESDTEHRRTLITLIKDMLVPFLKAVLYITVLLPIEVNIW